jgi:rod shape determining protein RodA
LRFSGIERSQRIDYFRKFDYLLMGVVLIINAIGLVFLHSAMYDMYADNGASAMTVQIAGVILGIIVALFFCFFDYTIFRNVCFPFYVFNLFVMLLVFTPIGIENYGSRSWIDLYVTTYQPSELMKIAMIILIAKYLERINENGMTLDSAIIILAGFFIPLGLVLLQKDLGMALVFIFIFLVMIFVGNVKLWQIGIIIGGGLAAVPFVWKFYLNGVKRDRFLSFLNPDKYQDYSLQLRRAMTAIGSGQLFGKGYMQGPLNRGRKIPVKMSDMIFAVICEEGGFIAGFAIVVLMTIMLLRMLQVSHRARDVFGSCIAAGIFAMFAFNIFENIGMNIGIMPITGLPLPFVSKGGSAMVTNFFSIGLLLSISLRNKKGMFIDD